MFHTFLHYFLIALHFCLCAFCMSFKPNYPFSIQKAPISLLYTIIKKTLNQGKSLPAKRKISLIKQPRALFYNPLTNSKL